MTTRTGQRFGTQPTSPEGRRSAGARPIPELNNDFAHLTLSSLRAYRRTLSHEESRVSYWRLLIQARLDVLRDDSGTPAHVMDQDRVDRLKGVLSEARPGESRQALVTIIPIDDIPPLPDLEELWSREVRADDPVHSATLVRDLAFAELQLSAYRSALHARLGAATHELIARYRENPSLCLTALPSR